MKAKKIIIPVSIVAGIGLIAAAIILVGNSASAVSYTETEQLEKTQLRNYISVSGTVESSNFNRIYSELSYPVESVNVEVGDTVKKGDILCTLNTDELQSSILQQQALIDSSNITESYQLTAAEKNYNDALAALNDETNSQIVAAKNTLTSAEINLANAQEDYDNAVEMSSADKSTQIKTAQLNLENAQRALETAQADYEKAKNDIKEEDYYEIQSLKKAYDDAKETLTSATTQNYPDLVKAINDYTEAYRNYVMFASAEYAPNGMSAESLAKKVETTYATVEALTKKYKISNARDDYDNAMKEYEKKKIQIDTANSEALKSAERSLENAKQSLKSAEINLDSVNQSTDNGIKNYKTQLAAAQLSYENAKEQYNLTVKSVEADVAALKTTAERERTLSGTNDSQLIVLENYKSKLDNAVIVAPCDGTVTMVNASVGAVPSGTLFAIEDLSDLKVSVNLREYDIDSVEVGMPVMIKTTASGDTEYEGIVTKVAPTASKNIDGTNSGTSLFKAEIAITSKDTLLKVGMTANCKIILEEADDVYAVICEAVLYDEDGSAYIFTAQKNDVGYTAVKTPVTVGIVTDYLTEISGDAINDDTIVITDTFLIKDGDNIMVNENPEQEEAEETEQVTE